PSFLPSFPPPFLLPPSSPPSFPPFCPPFLLSSLPSSLDPSFLRSSLAQDISHLLTSLFKNLYTLDVIGEDIGRNLIKSRGGENVRHEKFVDELQQLRDEYIQKLADTDMVERHIIQARARALAEEDRILNNIKAQGFGTAYLPPVRSTFRWCVDGELLRKSSLICPGDYIRDPLPFSRAPKGNVSLPECYKMTFSSRQHSVGADNVQVTEMASKEKLPAIPSEVSLSTLTKCSTPDVKPPKTYHFPKNKMWVNHLNTTQRVQERRLLARLENQHSFLKNPRFFPPNTVDGGKSLILPVKKTGAAFFFSFPFPSRNFDDAPVFLPKPSVAFFTDYVIGPVYEIVLELQNVTSTSRPLRVLPPSTPYFSLGLGKFPGKGGLVAPGMICQYTVRFAPDSLGDFDDFILVETQAARTLVIPLQARRSPPILTLALSLDCGYCLVGGIKMTRFICKNVGLSTGRFCIMPKSSWPPPSFRAVAKVGFVEQAPFGILPAVFELVPGQELLLEVLFLPTSLETVEKSFIIVCDNCQIKEVIISGTGQLAALELLYVSGEASHPEPGELTDLTAQHFIRFGSQNIQTTTSKHLVVRNLTHVALPFHWQIVKPNLLPLMLGEIWRSKDIKYYPDSETAFYVTPGKGSLQPHADHEFILSFSPEQLKNYHSVIQIVLEEVPVPIGLENENICELPYAMDDIIALEIEVKGSVEPFQILLEPYAIIIPGENYIGVNVKKDFKMWNNSKSAIRYTWEKISDCHIVEVEPYTGVIDPNEKGEFELNFTGGVPGVTSQELLCKIERSPVPVVLHIEAAFKGPTLSIDVSALQLGLVRLGKKAVGFVSIQNTSQLPAKWKMRESPACLKERKEKVSPFIIRPPRGRIPPLGQLRVTVLFEAKCCRSLRTVLELQVENGEPSYLPVYGEVQRPYVYLMSSQLVLSDMYFGIPTEATVTLFNGTLLPTKFLWGKLLGTHSSLCLVDVCPRNGLLGPNEEKQVYLRFTAFTMDELTDLALLCHIEGVKKSLVLGISGKPKGLDVTFSIPQDQEPSSPQDLCLDFGSSVPLRFFPTSLEAESSLYTVLFLDSIETLLSKEKGAAFFPHVSQGTLDAFQKLTVDITACSNMWGDYHDQLICKVGGGGLAHVGVSRARQRTSEEPRRDGRKGVQLGVFPGHIRIDWETYSPEENEDKLLDFLVVYGTPFPLRDAAGVEMDSKEEPTSDSSFVASSSHGEDSFSPMAEGSPNIISVILQPHEGVRSDHPYTITPRQLVIPAAGSSSVHVSFTPMLLPGSVSKMVCKSYALGFMSLDNKIAREIPGKVKRPQNFDAELFRLDLQGLVRPAAHKVVARVRAGGLGRDQPCPLWPDFQVLPERVITHRLKVNNFTDLAHCFGLLVAPPFSVTGINPEYNRRILDREVEDEEEEPARDQFVLNPQQNMLVGQVSFTLSLELLTYQKLPSDQMLPGVTILQDEDGARKMEFSQELVLEYANKTTQVVPLLAIVSIPSLQLSTSWVDFGTCFVNETYTREVTLLNLSSCRSHWITLTDKQERHKAIFQVYPTSGVLEARKVNSPPTSTSLYIHFTASCEYEAVVTVDGILGEACILHMRGQGSYDEKY
uniref:DLEC1 cilia and flagella associated protein n=1 Tax=Vombatus ursinus TaxID=29139 RepID=A0A4X2LA31_VOMUR